MKKLSLLPILILALSLPVYVQGQASIQGQTRLPTGCTTGQLPSYSSVTNLWSCTTVSASAVWGAITGTLTDQSDLVTVLAGKLSTSGGTLTDTALAGSGSLAGSVLSLAQTWNTSGTPSAILLDVTNTASNAGSYLIRLRVGGINKFTVQPTASVSSEPVLNLGGFLLSIINGRLNTGSAMYFQAGGAGQQVGTQWGFGNGLFLQGVVSIGNSNTPTMQGLAISGSTSQTAELMCIHKDMSVGALTSCDGGVLTKDGYWKSITFAATVLTVATLPAAPTEGQCAWVNDALSAVNGTILASGGSVHTLTCNNGTNWIVK